VVEILPGIESARILGAFPVTADMRIGKQREMDFVCSGGIAWQSSAAGQNNRRSGQE
jgi:hypothetical protein